MYNITWCMRNFYFLINYIMCRYMKIYVDVYEIKVKICRYVYRRYM